MEKVGTGFLNIKYDGERFSGGRLPLDVLADLQALEDILATFAREIWLEENGRERMPSGYTDWFSVALTGVGIGSALPKLELLIEEDPQQSLMTDRSRAILMQRAEQKFANVMKAADQGRDAVLSPTQIRNFNRFLTNLKQGELFKYSPDRDDPLVGGDNVIAIDFERRRRFLASITPFYEQRVQGRARLKSVDENGNLRFVSAELKEFPLVDDSREPADYGAKLGSYYEYDLTVKRRHDDRVHSVVTIHELSLLEDPAVAAIEEMASLADGWLDGFGQAVPEHVRTSAKSFIASNSNLPEFYAIAPTEHGGILLEYECNGWDYGIEFHSDNSFTVFGIELEGSSEFSETFGIGDYKMFCARFRETLYS
jgi:hypothetical protein